MNLKLTHNISCNILSSVNHALLRKIYQSMSKRDKEESSQNVGKQERSLKEKGS